MDDNRLIYGALSVRECDPFWLSRNKNHFVKINLGHFAKK
jgi:hypothetical protein